MFKMRWSAACVSLSLLTLPTLGRAQNVGKDVPPSHWAYEAVRDLVSKNLVQGFPPDNRFLGGRTLTRYEMATILERVITRMDNLLNEKSSKADLQKLQNSAGEIRDLIEEFRKELLVIGTDMGKVKEDLAALKMELRDLTERVNSLEDRVNNAQKRADDADLLAQQALENLNEQKNATNAALGKKVDVGNGKLRVSGLLQVWAGTAFGNTLNGNKTNFGSAPPGRSFGGGVGDTMRLRRGEIGLNGNITPRVDYRIMIDVAKAISLTGGDNTADPVVFPSVNGPTNVLQDLWVGYQIAPRFRIEVGQQKTGLSEEGTRSSSQLHTVERSIMNGLPGAIGRVGDIRDNGIVARYQGAKGNVMLGVFNDNGVTQDGVDNDRQKFAMFNAYFTGIRHLTVGVWGGTNIGDTKPATGRERLGGTVLYQSGPHFFELEAATTRDYAAGKGVPGQGTRGVGGYALYAHSLSKRWQLVGRYDVWDPSLNRAATAVGFSTPFARNDHSLFEYTLGFTYYILGHNAKIQVNYIWDDPQTNAVTFFGKRRQVLLAGFQTAF